jgi:AraC-like DNA-binding protein
MLLGILFCGSLLIFFLMRSNYKPIQKIVRYSREQGGLVPGMEEAGGGQRIGDIDLIQLTLENICKNNLNLEDRNKEYLRNGILFCLLKGTAPSDPAQFQKAGIDTGGVQHTVVIFRLDEDKVIPIDEFGRLLEKHLSPRSFKIYLLDYLEKNNFVGIFICHRESPHVRDILEKLCLETGREAGVEIKAAYGDEVRRIEEVSSSYFQARMVLRYQIQKSTRKTLGFQEMKRDIGAPANRNTILKYIEDHYQESEFCVQSVADHFGMSISNLSHQFKSYTGENIASRISVLRMHYAKELLTFTNRPVGEIAGQLGYFQPSSFIKKFKTTEGVTPGEYRISHLGGGVTPGGC